MQALVLGCVFFGTALLIFGTYTFLNRRRLAAAAAARERLQAVGITPAPAISILKEDRASNLSVVNRLIEGRSITARIAALIERAGSTRTPGEVLLSAVVFALFAFWAGSRVSTLLGLPLAILAAALPFFNLKRAAKKRQKAFEAQLPDAIDMLVNALKAGYSLQAAMNFVGHEVTAPLGPEFARFYDEQRLGVDVRTALLSLQNRTDILDLRMFVTSLLIQRETGGNLSEVLTNLATLMRERVTLRGQVDSLTAEPKFSARFLALLPIGLLVIMSGMNREFILPMLTSPGGRIALMYGAVSIVIGYIVMMKIADVDV